MKDIKFRPLRRIAKTGKIVVASYPQWRAVKVADRNGLRLLIDEGYKDFKGNEQVYNSRGEHLFWNHYNPEEIPMLDKYALVDGKHPDYPEMWQTDYMVSARGLDVEGVPRFSHFSANEIAKDGWYGFFSATIDMQPLTVDMVRYWFGWFIYKLKNTELVFTKTEH